MAVISETSLELSAQTAAAPEARIMFTTSLMVTALVMAWISGRFDRILGKTDAGSLFAAGSEKGIKKPPMRKREGAHGNSCYAEMSEKASFRRYYPVQVVRVRCSGPAAEDTSVSAYAPLASLFCCKNL